MGLSSDQPAAFSESETTDSDEAPAPGPGDIVGAYRLVKQLGQGASGVVYEVEHTKIGRRAAMKILSRDHAARPGAIRRLLSEAQAVNRINHPHIVEISDVVDASVVAGVNAIVMELLEGESLAQVMVQAGPMPPERFIPILIQVADALAAAHGSGFIHRDLKPENIFLTARGGQSDYVKLLDFGIAKSLDPPAANVTTAGGRNHATVEGTFLGTPAYASPEQISSKTLDNRTDLYSFGVIAFELATGRLPFEGNSLGEYLVKHVTMPPPPFPAGLRATPWGPAMDAMVQRCLQKNPALRFRSAGEIRELLSSILTGDLSPAPLASGSRRRKILLGGGVLGLGLLGAAVTASLRKNHVQPVSHPAPAPQPAAAPVQVTIRFETDPPGAETRQLDSGTLLGLAPFAQSFPINLRSPVTVAFTLPGHDREIRQVDLSTSSVIKVKLSPSPPSPAPPLPEVPAPRPRTLTHTRPKTPPKSNGAATIDPFAR